MMPELLQSFGSETLAIETQRMTKRFGNQTAVADMSLAVPEGGACLLVGENGAGKTTTIRVLLDLVRPDEGSAQVLGMNTRTRGPRIRSAIGWVPETTHLPRADLPVGKFLQQHASYYVGWDPAYAATLVDALEIPTEQRCGTLSKGQGRRVQLVAAMAHRPAVLLLDEPADGLDPVMRDRFASLLAAHTAETPTTVLLSTHHVVETELFATQLVVLQRGRMLAQLDRATLDRKLLRVSFTHNGEAVPENAIATLQARSSGTMHEWVVWGDAGEVTSRLAGAGAEVRECRPLRLVDAAVTLMQMEETT